MVGLVLVSHCRALADAVAYLARQVSSNVDLPIAAAGGIGDGHAELGTDAMDIMEAIESVYSDDGILVLMDMGSAILSAKTALEFLESEKVKHISLCSAPLVEGAVSAAVQISIGSSLEVVKQEACTALTPKQLELDNGTAATVESYAEAEGTYLSYAFVSRLKNGLHARPAALLASTASSFKSTVKVKNISRNKGPETARSINKLALLGILLGDDVEVRVSGDDQEDALCAIRKLADDNFGESPAVLETGAKFPDKPLSLAPGIAMGRLYREGDAPPCPKMEVSDAEAEVRRFDLALARVRGELETHEAKLAHEGHADEAGIFNAQKLILTDEELIDDVKKVIFAEKLNAAYVYRQTMNKLAADYRKLPGGYLSQRAADIDDVASRVLAVLTGQKNIDAEDFGDIILAAREVQPSMLVRFENRIRGILSETGGITSHAAILAKAIGIPAISGYHVDEGIENGTPVIIDGKNCSVTVNPDSRTQADFQKKLAGWEEKKKQDFEESKKNAVTKDGVKVYVRANIGEKRDAQKAVDYNAEGIGLLRTEFLFLSRTAPPGEETQAAMLREILEFFPDDPVTIRTLDIGGDKPLPWLDQQKEENPFLGMRGVRLCRKERQLFAGQLRAILRAGTGFKIKIMAPMVSGVEEVHFCKEMLASAHTDLDREGIAHLWPVPFGIMVETPAAALMADKLAAVSDFFSIGSNDLSQYIMSAERGNSALSELANAYQAAVLRAIKMTADAARKAGIPVSVCGEMAGDPLLSQLLVGMGICELSMNPGAIGGVKRVITHISQKDAKEKVLRCLDCAALDDVMDVLENSDTVA
ncbi:MAG: phosphoenolpyruvate--protein phosphotransferase [Spirochaetaceae bacterium]|nr:phosphoenolpyruvate--protein phosphotransferase [Spirochaetaceae bacterium]